MLKVTLLSILVKPEMVQLVASETTVCQGENITFNCSANSNPAVHTYELYVNETMVSERSSTGVWNRATTTGGMFFYKCKASNTIGTTMSMDVFVTINGKRFLFFSMAKVEYVLASVLQQVPLSHSRMSVLDLCVTLTKFVLSLVTITYCLNNCLYLPWLVYCQFS